ncbi:MAG: hypothetical protein EA402_14270 [Planctomycetota bacterium]|nr:MAG: hypothetical protein EA402_14270 [Planctomycetota bacterium]
MSHLTSLFLALALASSSLLLLVRAEEAPSNTAPESTENLLPQILPDQTKTNQRQQLTLVLPGIGGRSDRSIAIRVNVVNGQVAGNPEIRSWTFQDRLQPSHIRRLERQVTAMNLEIEEQRIRGQLKLRMAGPRQLGNPAVEYLAQVHVDLRLSSGPAPMLRDDFSTPPWRRVDFPLHGAIFQGTYEGTWTRNQQSPEHRFHAAWASLQDHLQPGGSSRAEGDWPSHLSVTEEGHLLMSAELPYRPVGASESATQRWQLAKPLDLKNANALRLRWRSAAHAELAARVLINDWLGQQWSYPRSLPLLGGERETILPLAGFQPDWYTATFDLETQVITGFGISIPAGNGPGPVTLELLAVEAVFVPELSTDYHLAQVRLQPNRALISEGQGRIHPALFGVHGVGQIPEQHHETVAAMGIGSVRTIEHSDFSPRRGGVASGELRHLVEITGSSMAEAIHSFTMGLFDPPPWMNGNEEDFLKRLRGFGRSVGEHGFDPEARPDEVQWIEIWNDPFLWGRHNNKP